MSDPFVPGNESVLAAYSARARPFFRPRTGVSELRIGLGLVAYRLLVDVGYAYLVAGPYAYWGFRGEPSVGRQLMSWMFFLALLPSLVRVLRSERLSAQFAALLSLISMVPTSTLIANDPRYPVAYILLMFVYWIVFLLAAIHLPSIRIFRRPLLSDAPHLVAAAVLSAAVVYTSWRFTGFRLQLGLLDVYDIRVEARGFSVPPLIGYLGNFADNVLPVLLAYYLRRRWYLVALAVGVVIFFNFGIAGTKQVIFLLLFGLASVFVGEPPRFNSRITAVLGAVVSLAILERFVFGTIFLGTFSLYRVFAIPAHLHWLYFDFFQGRDFVHLTQSILKFFFESPFADNVQFLVGEYDQGEYGGRANNGLFSDGYMNFGSYSVLFFPVICVVLLKALEGAVEGLSSSVRFIVLVSLSFVFIGLPLTTAVLSAGVGVLLMLLPTMPRLDGGVDGRVAGNVSGGLRTY